MLRILVNPGNAPASAAVRSAMASGGGGRNHLDRLTRLVKRWVERGRSRRALAALDDRQLRDVGLTRADMRIESEKPFWRV